MGRIGAHASTAKDENPNTANETTFVDLVADL